MGSFSIQDCLSSRIAEAAAVSGSGRQLSSADLSRHLVGLTARLRNMGIGHGATVGIDVADPVEAFLLALALNWQGSRWFRATRETVYSDVFFYDHVISDRMRPKPPQGRQHVLQGPLPPQHEPQPRPCHRFSPDDIIFFGQSSGTTGVPKILPMTAGQLHERSRPELFLCDLHVPKLLSRFHPLHMVSYYSYLRALRKGGVAVFEASVTNPNHVLLSPAMATSLVERQPVPRERTASCWVGGGPLYPPLARQLLRHFLCIAYTYGSQEAGNAAFRLIRNDDEVGSADNVGTPARNADLKIVDEQGRRKPPGEDGIICYRTPSIISGYLGPHAAHALRDGFFYPGDLGRVNPDGTLSVVGRVVDQLNIGGAKLNAAWVDEVASSVPGVADAGACTHITPQGRELLVVLFQAKEAVPEDTGTALHDVLSRKFGIVGEQALVFRVPTIPRNENGKLDRSRLSEIAANELAKSS